MKKRNLISSYIHTPWLGASRLCLSAAAAGLILAGCGGASSDNSNDDEAAGNTLSTVSLDLALPDSITGGQSTGLSKGSLGVANKTGAAMASAKPGDLPCSYLGNDADDPFSNGYETTKFMVSVVATWSCVADVLIDVSDYVPHDGTMIEADNDLNADNYDPEEPTHYVVVDDSDVQTSVRLYYGYDRELPPTLDDTAGFYISWTEDNDGTLRGRLIIEVSALGDTPNDEDPSQMRMDFTQDESRKVSDMFLRFPDTNPWADGWRIRVSKQLEGNPLGEVFVAQGLMAMTAQFIPTEGVTELPEVATYAVANQMGDGAAIAQINNMSWAIPLNTESSLGAYLMSKEDVYFFDDDQTSAQPWDWIAKSFTSAIYKGGRTAPATEGTWVPFNPSLNMIETALSLETDYFADTCVEVGDDCEGLINAIFLDGFAEQEPNQGEDPNDWRSLSLQSVTYLDTVYPNGVDWTGAFEQNFQP